jgi:site-specific DNA-cytosine methylase
LHTKNLQDRCSPEECEELQSIPIDYTSGISNTQRYKMIGNGWTVDVIAHIFKGLKETA